MNWLNPIFLFITAAALVAAILCWRIGAWRKNRALRALLGRFAGDPQTVKLSRPRRFLRHLLLGVSLILLGVTAARPYWKRLPMTVSSTGRDVLVLFDVSKSMRSTDLAPSRMEHARYLLREIVAAFPGDRFGLIAFAGKAYLSCPLTSDGVAFDQYVDELSTDAVPVGGTNLEMGFATALRAMEAAGGEEKTLLVMTDGEELSGDSARLLEKLKAAKVQLIIVGLGDAAGAPVLDDEGNFRRDADGKIILSKLNETGLRQIAQACDGIYLQSTVADNGFSAIKRALIRNRQKVTREMNRALPVENFTWLLLASIVLLTLYLVISERKKVALLLLAMGVWTLAGAEKFGDAYRNAVTFQQQGETEKAVAIYEKLLADPALPVALAARVRQNLGTVPHEAGRKTIAEAKKEVESQQLDAALQKLSACDKSFDDAESYYTGAFSAGANDFDPSPLLTDFALLDADRREAAELKKQIEELKKQQQQARNQVQQAKKENQQQQKSPRQKPQPPQSSRDEERKDQQNKASQSLKEAADAAKKLADSAEKMKQQKMRDAAKQAEKSLEEARQAQQKGDREEADKKIDEALAALGKEEKKQNQKKDESPGDKDDRPKAQSDKGGASREDKKSSDKSENDRLLQQMLDRENDRRRQLVPASGNGRIPKVEKDW